MNEIEVGRLLTAAKVLDPKMPEPDDQGFVLKLWTRSLHDVPAKVADEALTEYYRSARYRETREPISPADIVQWHKDRRRYQQEQRDRPTFDPDRIHAGVDKVLAAFAERKAITAGADPTEVEGVGEGEAGARRIVHSVRCPHPTCHADVGQRCTGSGGRPLTKTLAHPARVTAAYGHTTEGA